MTNLNKLIEQRQGEMVQKILDLLNAYTEVNVDNNCVYSNIDYNKARAPLIIALEKHNLQTTTEAYRQALEDVLAGLPGEHILGKDNNDTDSLIDELMKVHYEPEHEKGVTCWCSPKVIVREGIPNIEHNEQRIIIREFLESNFSDASASELLSTGHNTALQTVRAQIEGLLGKIE